MKPKMDVAMLLMKPAPAWISKLGPWIAKLEFREGGCEEAGV